MAVWHGAQYKGGEAYSCVSTRLPDYFRCFLSACALLQFDQRRCACSGVQIKTRKRNIAVALDPGSFSDAVVTIFEDARVDGDNLEQGLQGGVKVLDGWRPWVALPYRQRKCLDGE